MPPRKPRLYSLFTKEGGRYIRLSPFALPKPLAVRTFQNSLLNGSMAGSPMYLRPVDGQLPLTDPTVRANRQRWLDSIGLTPQV